MKKSICLLLTLISLINISFAQNKFTISGTIRDAKSGELMIGALINVKELPGVGTTTNAYGYYTLSLKEGKYNIGIHYLGYVDLDTVLNLTHDIKLNIDLPQKSINLSEVVVSSEKTDENVKSTQMSSDKLDVKAISSIPVLFGEQDILKTIQLLPGIKGVSEGNTGFYVRGGAADENLILLDEATVYNPSHLLGFFSVFNSDAIKDVTVYKGGIPAEYGGRLSSVLDVRSNDGNNKNFVVTGGIGLIDSRLTVEGPIKKNKGSFIISGRRTYADLFLKLSRDSILKHSKLYFYDFNAKANYELGENDHIFLSGYFGKDVLGYSSASNTGFSVNWGNATGTFRWNHIFNNKLFLNSSLIFSNYLYQNVLGAGDAQFMVQTGIQDFAIKEDFEYSLSQKNRLKFGLSSIYHTFIPGQVTTGTAAITGPSLLNRTVQRRYGLESGAYVSDEYTMTSRLSFVLGLRYSMFNAMGPGLVYSYDNGGNVTDSATYKPGQIYKTYTNWEPRISSVYVLNETSSIKASYNRIAQYLFLLSNSTTSTPIDIWVPSSNIVKPQLGDQVALGYFKNLKKNTYEASVEVYYKNMQNLIDYKPGADLLLNKTVESQLYFGGGYAYGVEFFLKKKYGKFNGWIGYTLSRAFNKFDSINNGNAYPATQDIINDVSVVGIYELSKKITLSATFVYYTGNAVTFPSGKYEIDGQVANLYTERNGYRMPAYNRLDLGVTWWRKKTAKYESSWNLSLYNAYGQENAYSITFQQDPNNPSQTQAVQLSLFRWVPSITYNFKF